MNSQQATNQINEGAALQIDNLRNAGKDLQDMRQKASPVQGRVEGGDEQERRVDYEGLNNESE